MEEPRGRKRGTFAAVADKIPYLKELGVTTVEFMPVYEFEEMVIPKEKKLPDYLTWRKNEEKVLKEQGDGAPDTEKETLEEPSKKKEQLVEEVEFLGYVRKLFRAESFLCGFRREIPGNLKSWLRSFTRIQWNASWKFISTIK